jgi:hypothetical protein
MRRWISLALAVVLSVLTAAPAAAQRNSLADVVRASQSKRVVIDGIGDSTFGREGAGWGQGFVDAMTGTSQCAGILMPPNQGAGNNLTHSMAFVRRRLNQSTLVGPVVSSDLGLPGYPQGWKQYGVTVPMIGIDSPLTTTITADIASAGATSMTVADRGLLQDPNGTYTAYGKIGNEIISWTDITGTGAGTVTIARGTLGTTAASLHSSGSTIRRLMVWEGPQSAVLGVATLTGAIASAVSTADIVVDSTVGFTASGALRLPSGEVVTYTSITSTNFVGIVRNTIPAAGTAAAHSIGERVVQCYTPSGFAGMMGPDHPFGINTAMTNVLFTKSMFATSLSQATMQGELYTQATWVNTDSSFTNLATGTATVVTGSALGTLNKIINTLAAPGSDRASVTLNFGTNRGSTYYSGINGGAALLFHGVFGTDRPVGFVQTMGTSRGGFTLNTFHRTMNYYDTVNSINELRAGMVERYKVYRSCGDVDVGGNGGAALVHYTVFGHNETGGQGYAGVYQPGYPWTESPLASVGLLSNAPGVAGTTIDVDNGSSLRSAKGSLYIFDGVSDYEYVTYETATLISGTNYRLNNCARGQFGTEPLDLAVGMEVRQGFLQVNPKGFASDILFDYLWRRGCWVSAGGSLDDFYYVYIRPIPTSASPSTVADDSAASGDAQREFKLRAYTNAIETYCGSLPGFIVLDLADIIGGGEAVTNDDGAGSADNVHHTRAAYRKYAQRAVQHFAYGSGAGPYPVTGLDGIQPRSGIRGRPRRVVKGTKRKRRAVARGRNGR